MNANGPEFGFCLVCELHGPSCPDRAAESSLQGKRREEWMRFSKAKHSFVWGFLLLLLVGFCLGFFSIERL